MAKITIRNLEPAIKARPRARAAKHDRSIEQEAREILRTALCEDPGPVSDLATAIRRRLAPFGGLELPAAERDSVREPPGFGC